MNDLSGPDSHVHLPGDQSNHTVGMDPGWYHPWKCACWIHELPKHIMSIHIESRGLKLLQYKNYQNMYFTGHTIYFPTVLQQVPNVKR